MLAGLSTGSVYFLTVPSDHTVAPAVDWTEREPGGKLGFGQFCHSEEAFSSIN